MACSDQRGHGLHTGQRRLHDTSLRARRAAMLRRLGERRWPDGVPARISRPLRVREATIAHALAVLLPLVEECPTCHGMTPRAWWREEG